MISGREMVQHELANWFGDEFQKLDISVRYNLLYNVAMLVRNGFGDALCIRLDCQYPACALCRCIRPWLLDRCWSGRSIRLPSLRSAL